MLLWDHSVFSKTTGCSKSPQVLGGGSGSAAGEEAALHRAFTVDGTLIEAWASLRALSHGTDRRACRPVAGAIPKPIYMQEGRTRPCLTTSRYSLTQGPARASSTSRHAYNASLLLMLSTPLRHPRSALPYLAPTRASRSPQLHALLARSYIPLAHPLLTTHPRATSSLPPLLHSTTSLAHSPHLRSPPTSVLSLIPLSLPHYPSTLHPQSTTLPTSVLAMKNAGQDANRASKICMYKGAFA